MSINETAAMARQASLRLAAATTEQKNKALEAVRTALLANADAIIAANAEDMAQAQKDNLAAMDGALNSLRHPSSYPFLFGQASQRSNRGR